MVKAKVGPFGPYVTALTAVSTTRTNVISGEVWRRNPLNRATVITKFGVFVATAANLTECEIWVDDTKVASFKYPHGTAYDPEKLSAVQIPVPPGSELQVYITNASSTNSQVAIEGVKAES